MVMTIKRVDQITSTSARLVSEGGMTGPAGTPNQWEFQISTDPKFRFAVSCRWAISDRSDGTDVMPGLNAATTYYLRGRNRFPGAVEEWGPVSGFTTAAGAPRILAPASIMTEPAAIVVPEPILSISLNAGALPGFPAGNLLVDAPVACRTLGPDSDPDTCAIIFCTGGGPVDTFSLLMSNMPESATIEVWDAPTRELAVTGTKTTFVGPKPFRPSALLPGRAGYHSLLRSPTPLVGPWFVMVVRNAPVPGRVKHFEHLVVGRNRVTKNHSVEVSVAPQPLTTSERRRSGIIDRVPGMPLRRVEFELAVLTEAQFEANYQDLWRRENYPVLVVPNTKPGSFLHDRIFYGDLSGGRVSQSGIRYTRGFSVVSMI